MSLNYKEKNIIAVALLLGGALFLLFLIPPHSICDTHKAQFQKNNELFYEGYMKNFKSCQTTASPGGCYTLFEEISVFLKRIHQSPKECVKPILNLSTKFSNNKSGKKTQITKKNTTILKENLKLLSLLYGLGWLKRPEFDLFCQMKYWQNQSYGDVAWETFKKELQKQNLISKNKNGETLFTRSCRNFF